MKQWHLFLVFIGFSLVGCGSELQDYKYILLEKEKGMYGLPDLIEKAPETLQAPNDSIAYFKAYEKLQTAIHTYRSTEAKASGKRSPEPVRFILLNKEGKDVALHANYENQQASEIKIKQRIK